MGTGPKGCHLCLKLARIKGSVTGSSSPWRKVPGWVKNYAAE